MRKSIYSFFAIALIGTSTALAQPEGINGGPVNVPTEGIIDGVFIQEHIPTKRMIPYEHVREADVIWSKRVFEYIDLREKINHPLYFPMDQIIDGENGEEWVKNATRWSLWTVIRTHVMNGDLRIFSPFNPVLESSLDGYQLKYPVDPEPGMNYFTDSNFREIMNYSYLATLGPESDQALADMYGDDSMRVNPDGSMEEVYPPQDVFMYTSKDIIQYRIKEDWFMDKERSVLDVRIIALAPVVYDMEEDSQGNKSISGTKELFWLYFPHCRFVFNNYFVYNAKNDAQWMSFDDVFWKRRFNSVIYKTSNVYDRMIDSYQVGSDALFESQAIRNEIRNIEHDVWSF